MTSCVKTGYIYVADSFNCKVHRVDISSSRIKTKLWKLKSLPASLSVTSKCNVVVTLRNAEEVREFKTEGRLAGKIRLPSQIVNPQHTVELTTDQFAVSHGASDDRLKRVCIVNRHGVIQQQSGFQLNLNVPVRIVVNGFIFVADSNNGRILMLDRTTLNYVHEVVSDVTQPSTMWFDVHTMVDYTYHIT